MSCDIEVIENVKDLEKYYINADDVGEELGIKNSKIKVDFGDDKIIVKYPISNRYISAEDLWEFCYIEIIIYRKMVCIKVLLPTDLYIRIEKVNIIELWIANAKHITYGIEAFQIIGLGNHSFYFFPSVVDDYADFQYARTYPHYIMHYKPFIIEYNTNYFMKQKRCY